MIVDIIAGIVMLASVIIAILRGFIREVLTILGLIGGAIAAYIGGPMLAPVVRGWLGVTEGDENPEVLLGVIPYPLLGDILGYAIIFVVFVILLSVLSHFLAESVKNLGLGAVDRTLGMVFGVVRGVLFLGLLYLPVYYLVDKDKMSEYPWLESSKSHVYLEATSAWIATTFIPTPEGGETGEEGGSMEAMNEARKKLEDLNLLQKDENAKDQSTAPENKEGYTDEFRTKMDKLIEDATSGESDDKKSGYNE